MSHAAHLAEMLMRWTYPHVAPALEVRLADAAIAMFEKLIGALFTRSKRSHEMAKASSGVTYAQLSWAAM